MGGGLGVIMLASVSRGCCGEDTRVRMRECVRGCVCVGDARPAIKLFEEDDALEPQLSLD